MVSIETHENIFKKKTFRNVNKPQIPNHIIKKLSCFFINNPQTKDNVLEKFPLKWN